MKSSWSYIEIYNPHRRGIALLLSVNVYLDSCEKVCSLLLQTYNLDAQIGESSACATALLCGVKANLETVGLDSGGQFDNCFSSFNSKVESLIDWAQKAGEEFLTLLSVTVRPGVKPNSR